VKSLKKYKSSPLASKGKRRLVVSLSLVIFLSCVFAPVALAGAGDPWYTMPITWTLDFLLGVLGGIHDPADHIFYSSCGIVGTIFQACADRSVWGLFTQDQFDTVIQRGFFMFAGLAIAFISLSIIKSGVLLSYRNLSSLIKFEVNDALVKTVVATILISQFFPIATQFFNLNTAAINLFKNDLISPSVVKDNAGKVIPSDGKIIKGDRIEMNSLCENTSELTSPIARSACAVTVRGVSIWWEVFYLQRKFMIGILCILAPLWISCMFYPMLHGVTMTAWKELWSQIIAQAIHAALFWMYYHLIDNQMGWFQMLVGISLFIPISESIRFIFGASAGTGSKLAMAGTMVGAAGIMNMTKGLVSVGKGLTNASKISRGIPLSNERGGGGALRGVTAGLSGGGGGGLTGSNGGGGSEADLGAGRPMSPTQRKNRMAGEIGAGLGSAYMRMGLGFAGAGMGGGAGAYLGGELGAELGDNAGYRGGVLGRVTGKAAATGVAKATDRAVNFPKNFSEAYGQMTNRDGDWSAKTAKATSIAAQGGLSNVMAKSQPLTPEQSLEKAAEKREQAAERGGTAAEILHGRGSYSNGDARARARHVGRKVSPGTLTDLRDAKGTGTVYALETSSSSVLATRDGEGNYQAFSNLGRGNNSLRQGETVVTPFQIQGKGSSVRLVPEKEPYSHPGVTGLDGSSKVEFRNASYLHNEDGKVAFNGHTMDANLFVGEPKKDPVDLRRRNFAPKRTSV
jgi:hypothetical protein